MVLSVGGFVVLGLIAAGAMVWLRQPERVAVAAPIARARATPVEAAPLRLEPSLLLVEARRKASAWHRDATLISLSAGPLDASGVAPDGKVEITYGVPAGERFSGGAEAASSRLSFSSSAGKLDQAEEQGAKARIVPEPNCTFESAWAAAQRAGALAESKPSLRYGWSEAQARPIWELLSGDGELVRRMDGVSCSILTR
ncbi:MAG TPA: hypothetical protein VEQ58_20010 [Polyangiaceae bacterium]|nr:hypothetical protein [Polyangiaceae bacterium]